MEFYRSFTEVPLSTTANSTVQCKVCQYFFSTGSDTSDEHAQRYEKSTVHIQVHMSCCRACEAGSEQLAAVHTTTAHWSTIPSASSRAFSPQHHMRTSKSTSGTPTQQNNDTCAFAATHSLQSPPTATQQNQFICAQRATHCQQARDHI